MATRPAHRRKMEKEEAAATVSAAALSGADAEVFADDILEFYPLSHYDRTIEERPNDNAAQKLFARALIHLRQGRADEGLADLNRATDIEPDFALAHAQRGFVLTFMRRFDEALAAFDTAIALNPNIPKAHGGRAAVLSGWFKRIDEAIISYSKALLLYMTLKAPDSIIRSIAGRINGLCESKKPGYTGDIFEPPQRGAPSPQAAVTPQLRMGDVYETIDRLAAFLPDDERRTAFKSKIHADFEAAAGITAHETTGREKETPRPKTIADAKAEALAICDATLLGQLNKYEARLVSTDLPAEGLKSPEQAKAAARLAKTYQDLRARQLERGFDPLPKDDRVAEAQRLAPDFYRKHPKPRVKATRSPLRQRNSARTASPT